MRLLLGYYWVIIELLMGYYWVVPDSPDYHTKKTAGPLGSAVCFLGPLRLFTDTKSLDECTITLDVLSLQVVKHRTTLTYECGKCTSGTYVLVVLLHVLRKVLDTEGEECNLALCRAGVLGVFAILSEDLSFLFCGQIHCCK